MKCCDLDVMKLEVIFFRLELFISIYVELNFEEVDWENWFFEVSFFNVFLLDLVLVVCDVCFIDFGF